MSRDCQLRPPPEPVPTPFKGDPHRACSPGPPIVPTPFLFLPGRSFPPPPPLPFLTPACSHLCDSPPSLRGHWSPSCVPPWHFVDSLVTDLIPLPRISPLSNGKSQDGTGTSRCRGQSLTARGAPRTLRVCLAAEKAQAPTLVAPQFSAVTRGISTSKLRAPTISQVLFRWHSRARPRESRETMSGTHSAGSSTHPLKPLLRTSAAFAARGKISRCL